MNGGYWEMGSAVLLLLTTVSEAVTLFGPPGIAAAASAAFRIFADRFFELCGGSMLFFMKDRLAKVSELRNLISDVAQGWWATSKPFDVRTVVRAAR